MAKRSMQIDLGLRGVQQTVRGLRSAADGADRTADSYDRLTEAIERMARANQQAAQARPLTNGGSGGSGASSLAVRTPRGNMAKLQAAEEAYDPDDFDSRVRLRRAQLRVRKDEDLLNPPHKGFMEKASDAILTSRVGFGANGFQLMPLVNRVLPLVTEGLGKFALPLGFAAAALQTFVHVAQEAAQRMEQVGAARTLSGGTAGEIAGLQGLGIAPGDIAGAAAAFRQRISVGGDPYAMRAGATLTGGLTLDRNYGPQDEAGLLLKALDKLHELRGNPEEQLRLSRQAGLDWALPTVNASDALYKQMRADMDRRAGLQGGASQFNSDNQAAGNNLQNAWNDVTAPTGMGIGLIQRRVNLALARILHGDLRPTNLLGDPSASELGIGGGGSAGGGIGAETQKDAVQKNTEALNKVAALMKEGVNGGGERAQSAVPRALRGYLLDQAIASDKWSLGAFR